MKNLNADFLLDIWADLKAKRLAPVAIGLVAAVVAMPALMLKGGDAPAEGPLPVIAPAASDGAQVEVAAELAEGDSKLDSYKARDPFDGLVKPDDGDAGSSGAAIAPSDLLGKAGGDDGAELPSLGGGGGGSTAPDSLTAPRRARHDGRRYAERDPEAGSEVHLPARRQVRPARPRAALPGPEPDELPSEPGRPRAALHGCPDGREERAVLRPPDAQPRGRGNLHPEQVELQLPPAGDRPRALPLG